MVLGFLKRDVTYEAIFYDLTKNWIVCYYDVTYSFKSESTLYSFLNIKELLARNLRDIRSLKQTATGFEPTTT